MCPLVKELRSRKGIRTVVCVSGQHREMLDQVLEVFEVEPDYDLSIMIEKQTLFDITVNILTRIRKVLEEVQPDVVLVHGDTSTTFVTALACFTCRYRSVMSKPVFERTILLLPIPKNLIAKRSVSWRRIIFTDRTYQKQSDSRRKETRYHFCNRKYGDRCAQDNRAR